MGMDLYISEQTDFRTDEKGRQCYTVVELYNFESRGSIILENLSDLYYELGNCSTKSVDAMEFLKCLESMKEQLKEINETGQDPYNSKSDLEAGIEDLECFIEENEVDKVNEYGDRTFEVHLWY